MTIARFTITHAGPQITVQDAGRFGMLRYGVPPSGPMDRLAFHTANRAVGNTWGSPATEISVGGLTLHCTEGHVSFGVTGGSFQTMLDEQRLAPWCLATIRSGQTVTIRPGRWGSWCYLAFAGELQTDEWLGSSSTHGPSGFGGGALLSGATLMVRGAKAYQNHQGAIAIPVSARPRHRVRVVLGPQHRFFATETIKTLLSSRFTLTDAYDRMGVRLSGPPLHPNAALDMPSEPIVRGSIQVAGDGVATVLLADHQTTGGYPKIATILSDDLGGFVQLRPHSDVAFELITAKAAIEAIRTRQATRPVPALK